MKLRALQQKDAPLMLEWMHDEGVVKNLQTNFSTKTLADCERFICNCADDPKNLHMAIVNENDEYLGTVSLKYIDPTEKTAEFAITIRACAMGKGISAFGMQRIIEIGLQELDLQKVYWCVSPDNKRAVRFYDKNEYPRVNVDSLSPIGYTEEQLQYYIWYAVTK